MTAEQAYYNRIQKRVKGLRNSLIILFGIEVVLVVVFSVLGAVDSWVWFCAGLLPAIALWFLASIVLLIIWLVNRSKLIHFTVPSKKIWSKKFNDNTKTLFISLSIIMVMVVITSVIHLILIDVRRYRVGPMTNVSLFSSLIGIAGIVAYVFFFYVFIKMSRISKRYEEVGNKGVTAAWVFLSGLILLLPSGIMDVSISLHWIINYNAFFLTKRILTIISLILIAISSFYLDTTINNLENHKQLEKRKNIKYLLTFSSSLLPIIILAETIIRPILYERYYPLCGDENYWYSSCERTVASAAAWFSGIVFAVVTICLCVYFYSLYLTTIDHKTLIAKTPIEEIIPVSGQVVQQPYVPGVGYPIRVLKPFMIRYETNIKFSFYSLVASIGLGVIVCITFLVDTDFEMFAKAGSTFLTIMGGAIIVFHIFFTRFSLQIKEIMSYDEKTRELGEKFFTFTTFGIYFLYLGFFVNIMFTPRITSVFVISRSILFVCFILITYGFYNLYKILKYYQSQGLLEKNKPLYTLLPYSSFAITALLLVETIIRKVIHQIYYYRQSPQSGTWARSSFYRQKAVWLGSLDLVFFTLLLAVFAYSLFVTMKDLKPVLTKLVTANKVDDQAVIQPFTPVVVPAVEYSPLAEVEETVPPSTKTKPDKKTVPVDDMMYCESCGEKIRREAKFCEFCGATIQ